MKQGKAGEAKWGGEMSQLKGWWVSIISMILPCRPTSLPDVMQLPNMQYTLTQIVLIALLLKEGTRKRTCGGGICPQCCDLRNRMTMMTRWESDLLFSLNQAVSTIRRGETTWEGGHAWQERTSERGAERRQLMTFPPLPLLLVRGPKYYSYQSTRHASFLFLTIHASNNA